VNRRRAPRRGRPSSHHGASSEGLQLGHRAELQPSPSSIGRPARAHARERHRLAEGGRRLREPPTASARRRTSALRPSGAADARIGEQARRRCRGRRPASEYAGVQLRTGRSLDGFSAELEVLRGRPRPTARHRRPPPPRTGRSEVRATSASTWSGTGCRRPVVRRLLRDRRRDPGARTADRRRAENGPVVDAIPGLAARTSKLANTQGNSSSLPNSGQHRHYTRKSRRPRPYALTNASSSPIANKAEATTGPPTTELPPRVHRPQYNYRYIRALPGLAWRIQ